ncbi:MAG: decaprenyl-phosphate phosphoribosyltransferase [candidate division Zixibacteria bacterium]|nr:decaprenyl-phosphate phosphoribosyltransferase [candidate division Zixibacteria bacterium]
MLFDIIKLIRPAQWLKNGIIVLALVFAGELNNPEKIILAIIAIAVYCLLSSAVYTFNDLIDIERDKQHPLKKNRPLASGRIGRGTAVVIITILTILGVAVAWMINVPFFVSVFAFIVLNVAYTLWLKDIVIVDVIAVAMSFVIRAYAGAFSIEVPASIWMLINTLLLALFLGLGKRRHELVFLEDSAVSHRKTLSKYSSYLLDQFIVIITASVIVIYMLYSFSPEVSEKLGTDNLFVTIPFVVYGLFRYLYLIHREEQGGSPTSVLVNDKPILLTVLLWLITASIVLYVL